MRLPGVGLGLCIALCAGPPPPTFYRDVLPVLQERCQTCHRKGEAAPMPLTNYAETRPWAKAIRSAVMSGAMPPWHADSSVLRYRNDLSLTVIEKKTLTDWVEAGAPEGSPADAPPPRKFADGWRIAKPDAVFELPDPVPIPAKGVLDYRYFNVPTGFAEDKWVEMVEVRPSARRVVHHAIVTVRSPREYGRFGGGFLGGYAPGASPQIWKPGQARLVPAGGILTFQMHYTADGKAAVDRTQVGLVFARTPVRERVHAMRAINALFMIPPGDANYVVNASANIQEEVRLAAIRPHMHLRGKAFEMRVVFPDGRKQVVLRVPRYDFHWQPYYYLDQPVRLPAGSRVECTAVFDNSANNPRNPDPAAEVRWGEQSWEEMMIGWFDVLEAVR